MDNLNLKITVSHNHLYLNYPHPEDHTGCTTETSGFKTFAMVFLCLVCTPLGIITCVLAYHLTNVLAVQYAQSTSGPKFCLLKDKTLFKLLILIRLYGSYWHNSQWNRILTRLVWPLEIPRK